MGKGRQQSASALSDNNNNVNNNIDVNNRANLKETGEFHRNKKDQRTSPMKMILFQWEF